MANRFKPKRVYVLPPETVDTATLRAKAQRRRQALTAADCSTYVIGIRSGQPGIVCLCCGLGSSSPNDIEQRYCGFCHEFHSEEITR
ncbi:MAG: hypothetical protein R2932_59175 [Caldilineaceae bacterium]